VSADLLANAMERKILDAEEHRQILKQVPAICRQANIPQKYFYTSMTDEGCNESELNFVRNIPFHADQGKFGLCYTSSQATGSPLRRMLSMAGALLRNYINATLMDTQSVLQALKSNSMPDPSVLLIPDFYMGKSEGGEVAAWQTASLLGLLTARQASGKQTVIYVSHMAELGASYGNGFKDLIEEGYYQTK